MATLTAAGVNCSNGQLDGLYTGATANNTSYPIGSYLWIALGASTLMINSSFTAYTTNNSSANRFSSISGIFSPSVALAGTWKHRGNGVSGDACYAAFLGQRVA